MNRRTAITFLAPIAFFTAQARATVTIYINYETWQDQIGSHTTIGFAELPPNTLVTNHYESLGVLFTDGADFTNFNPNAFPNDSYGLLGGADDSITMEFGQPRYSIGVHFPGHLVYELYVDGSLIYVSGTLGSSGVGNFRGLTSTEPFDKVRIFDPLVGINIDDLHFGPPIPAPGALAFIFVAAAIGSRRRRA